MNYANTQTERDLHDAFMDEAAAHVKYKLFSRQAAEEGLGEIADEYDRIAGEELGHAEMWLRELGGISDTRNNLKQTIRGEMADYKTSYPNFAHNARGEGFDELADRFSMTGAVEEGHSRLFADMLDRLRRRGGGHRLALLQLRTCHHAAADAVLLPALRLQQPVYAAGYVPKPKLKKRELTPAVRGNRADGVNRFVRFGMGKPYWARVTFPARRQREQTQIVLLLPPMSALTFLMLGFQVRLVFLFEWETLLPNVTPLLQIAHFAMYMHLRFEYCVR